MDEAGMRDRHQARLVFWFCMLDSWFLLDRLRWKFVAVEFYLNLVQFPWQAMYKLLFCSFKKYNLNGVSCNEFFFIRLQSIAFEIIIIIVVPLTGRSGKVWFTGLPPRAPSGNKRTLCELWPSDSNPHSWIWVYGALRLGHSIWCADPAPKESND